MADEQDIDVLQAAADERVALARQAEADLLEQLQHRGLVDLWKTIRTQLHCERFLESRTGRAFTDRLIKTITDAQNEWLNAEDPTAPAVMAAHRRAQAAHMALFTLDEMLGDGTQAQADLETIQRDIGDD